MTFGGKDTELGCRFLQSIDCEFRKRTFSYLAERIRIDFTQLGSDAGFIGAAGLAKQAMETDPKGVKSSAISMTSKGRKKTGSNGHRKQRNGK